MIVEGTKPFWSNEAKELIERARRLHVDDDEMLDFIATVQRLWKLRDTVAMKTMQANVNCDVSFDDDDNCVFMADELVDGCEQAIDLAKNSFLLQDSPYVAHAAKECRQARASHDALSRRIRSAIVRNDQIDVSEVTEIISCDVQSPCHTAIESLIDAVLHV